MTTSIHIGWAPSDRIRRSVVLPSTLDRRVSVLAREDDSTPSTMLANTVEKAVAASCHETDEVRPVGDDAGERVQRAILLHPNVTEALDERVSMLRFGENGHGAEVDFSDLVTVIVQRYLDHSNGNGAFSTNGTDA